MCKFDFCYIKLSGLSNEQYSWLIDPSFHCVDLDADLKLFKIPWAQVIKKKFFSNIYSHFKKYNKFHITYVYNKNIQFTSVDLLTSSVVLANFESNYHKPNTTSSLNQNPNSQNVTKEFEILIAPCPSRSNLYIFYFFNYLFFIFYYF